MKFQTPSSGPVTALSAQHVTLSRKYCAKKVDGTKNYYTTSHTQDNSERHHARKHRTPYKNHDDNQDTYIGLMDLYLQSVQPWKVSSEIFGRMHDSFS